MKKTLFIFLLMTSIAQAQEDFADITLLNDWIMDNQSTDIGTTDWFQGNDTVFTSQQGAAAAYIAANFNNTNGGNDGGSGVICNYLILPDELMSELTFYTRTTAGSTFPDRLRVLYSPNGGSLTDNCTNGFGDFTEELLVINDNLEQGVYPQDWTEYSVFVPGSGRVALVYHVTSAGPSGANSDYIGIDTVSWNNDLIFMNGFE